MTAWYRLDKHMPMVDRAYNKVRWELQGEDIIATIKKPDGSSVEKKTPQATMVSAMTTRLRLLLIIPGIIATFRYAMAFFIIADDEDCGPLEAITRSKEMMKGNKWKFFCLNWRFFGWSLLAVFFTFGIGFLWIVPYMQTSFAKFYEDVK